MRSLLLAGFGTGLGLFIIAAYLWDFGIPDTAAAIALFLTVPLGIGAGTCLGLHIVGKDLGH